MSDGILKTIRKHIKTSDEAVLLVEGLFYQVSLHGVITKVLDIRTNGSIFKKGENGQIVCYVENEEPRVLSKSAVVTELRKAKKADICVRYW